MRREGFSTEREPAARDPRSTESGSGSGGPALPIEYRYNTWFVSSLLAGLALFLILVSCARGPLTALLLPAALAGVVVGLLGFFADPWGFVHTPGKRIIVTDAEVEEVDEKGRVKWRVTPAEIRAIRVAGRKSAVPRRGGFCADSWVLDLHGGGSIRIPVWLLPDRGARFKRRLSHLLRLNGHHFASPVGLPV